MTFLLSIDYILSQKSRMWSFIFFFFEFKTYLNFNERNCWIKESEEETAWLGNQWKNITKKNTEQREKKIDLNNLQIKDFIFTSKLLQAIKLNRKEEEEEEETFVRQTKAAECLSCFRWIQSFNSNIIIWT